MLGNNTTEFFNENSKRFFFTFAVLFFVVVSVAVLFVLNRKNGAFAPISTNETDMQNYTNSSIALFSENVTPSIETEPLTTANKQKIVYKEGKATIPGIARNGLILGSPGYVVWDCHQNEEVYNKEDDLDALFFVGLDTGYSWFRMINISSDDYSDYDIYLKAVLEAKKDIMLKSFDELGLSFNYQGGELYIGYVNKNDIETLKKMPVSVYLTLLPKDFNYEKWQSEQQTRNR